MTTPAWPTAERALDHLGARETYSVGDLVTISEQVFSEALSRRYVLDVCRQYELVLGVELERRGRRNFMEIVLSREQVLDLLSLVRESRDSPRSINSVLRARRAVASPLPVAPAAPVSSQLPEGIEEMPLQDQLSCLIVETLECKARASGAEETALGLQQELTQVRAELAQVNAKFDELLSLLRR